MSRSVALFLLAAGLLFAAGKSNVLLVITDDQGYGDMSFIGNPALKTPPHDLLAAESVRYGRFYVSPFCAPTRASLLTGRYSLRASMFRAGAHNVRKGRAEVGAAAEAVSGLR